MHSSQAVGAKAADGALNRMRLGVEKGKKHKILGVIPMMAGTPNDRGYGVVSTLCCTNSGVVQVTAPLEWIELTENSSGSIITSETGFAHTRTISSVRNIALMS